MKGAMKRTVINLGKRRVVSRQKRMPGVIEIHPPSPKLVRL